MGIVDYGSSDEEEDVKDAANAGGQLPPLPDALHDLYQTAPKTVSKDPEFHQGRKRTFEHVDGQWPTHVFIQWVPDHKTADKLEALLSNELGMESLVRSELGVPKPLHISLSDTLMVTTDKKNGFLERITKDITQESLGQFDVVMKVDALALLKNAINTRAFVTIVVNESESLQKVWSIYYVKANLRQLQNLIACVNCAASGLGLPMLRTDMPHVSLGWVDLQTGKRVPEVIKVSKVLTVSFKAEELKIKMGRDVHNVKL